MNMKIPKYSLKKFFVLLFRRYESTPSNLPRFIKVVNSSTRKHTYPHGGAVAGTLELSGSLLIHALRTHEINVHIKRARAGEKYSWPRTPAPVQPVLYGWFARSSRPRRANSRNNETH